MVANRTNVGRSADQYPQLPVWVGGIFFLYVGTFFLQAGSRIDFLETIRLEFSLAAFLLLIAVPRSFSVSVGFPTSPITVPLFLFIILVSIQVPLSINVDHSYVMYVDRYLKFSAMGLFIAVFAANPLGLKLFVAAFMLSCFKMGQEGLVGHISGSMIWENQGVMRLHGSTRMYAHPNSFAGMAMGTVPFIYYLYPVVNKYVKAMLLVMVVFAANIILYSGSRTAYVGFVAFIAYLLRKAKNKGKFILAFVVLSVALAPVIPQDYVHRFESIFTGEEKEGSSSDARLQILQDSLVVFAENPFGVGVAAFPTARAEKFGRSQDTHNLYMEIATNIGIQGLIVFLVLIGLVFREYKRLEISFASQLRRLLPHEKHKNNLSEEAAQEFTSHVDDLKFMQAVGRAAIAYIFIRLCLGMFGHDLYEIYWWVGFGLLYALFRADFVAKRKTESVLASIQSSRREHIASV